MIGFLRFLERILTRSVLVVLLVLSISLTVLSLTVTSVQVALSGALSVVGVSTVAAREVAAAHSRRAAARRVTADTAKRVSNRVTRSAARNSASVFGEAIPVAGVAVIAGALAFEIRDACATARDMAGLEAMAADPVQPIVAFDTATAGFNCSTLIPAASDLPGRAEIWEKTMSAPLEAWSSAKNYYQEIPTLDIDSSYAWMRTLLSDVYDRFLGEAE